MNTAATPDRTMDAPGAAGRRRRRTRRLGRRVGLRGPGETQLEVDRRSVRDRIAHLKRELEKVRAHRMRYRSQRKRARIQPSPSSGIPTRKIHAVEPTDQIGCVCGEPAIRNAGPTTRRIELPGGYQALLTDTVGFIQKLPTALVEPSTPHWKKSRKPTCSCTSWTCRTQRIESISIRPENAGRNRADTSQP